MSDYLFIFLKSLTTEAFCGVAESEHETAILCVDSLRLCVFARDKNHTINQQRHLIYTHQRIKL